MLNQKNIEEKDNIRKNFETAITEKKELEKSKYRNSEFFRKINPIFMTMINKIISKKYNSFILLRLNIHDNAPNSCTNKQKTKNVNTIHPSRFSNLSNIDRSHEGNQKNSRIIRFDFLLHINNYKRGLLNLFDLFQNINLTNLAFAYDKISMNIYENMAENSPYCLNNSQIKSELFDSIVLDNNLIPRNNKNNINNKEENIRINTLINESLHLKSLTTFSSLANQLTSTQL